MTKLCFGAPAPTAPSFAVPALACDCHNHVLGPYSQYPLAEDRVYTAPEAPLEALREMLRVMHLERSVIAHVSAHGTDFRVTLDAIQEFGKHARGTIMLLPSITDADLRDFHDKGIRGVRLAHAFGYDVTEETLTSAARRIAQYGWHIAIWPSGPDELKLIARVSKTLPVPVVLDHMAGHCWNPGSDTDQAGFTSLLSLLATGRVWLKISAMNRVSSNPFPWPELIPFGTKLVAEVPERLLWASDWPHVGDYGPHVPQSHELLDWLPLIGCDSGRLKQILSDNPARLYGF